MNGRQQETLHIQAPQNTFADADPVQLLKQLIAIPSVNPMGADVNGPIYHENGMTNWLIGFFQNLNVPYEVIEVRPGRCNVVARLDSPNASRTILLDAHQDTVPVEGMTIDPFLAKELDGRIYGRGACDVKGGMASMLSAFARLATEQTESAHNVIISCSCDEEYTALGVARLADMLSGGAEPDSLLALKPDICVVAEPTDLNVVAAHLGVVRWRLRTHGRACHSSRPHEGVNAIYKMGHLLSLLEEYAQQLPSLIGTHPLCGAPTLSVGKITGGISVNIVPDECEIEIDRRLIPGENPETVIPHLEAFLRSRTAVDFEMELPWIVAPSLSDHTNGQEVERILNVIDEVAGPHQKQSAWYCTNASTFASTGIPALVFGPGSIAQAHTCDEWVEISQLHQAAEIYYRLCTEPLLSEDS